MIRPSFATLKLADVPLNRTLVAPVKWLPLMVTEVPTTPLDGEKLLIVGADPPVTVKFGALVAVPDGVVTVILPVVAPAGTVVVIRRIVRHAEARRRPVEPHAARAGEVVPVDGDRGAHRAARRREAADRRRAPPVTVKFGPLVAVPDAVVTVILPVVAPAGTVDITWVFETKLNVADVPLNFTPLTPVRLVPLMVTAVPGAPLDGEKLLIVGMAGTTKSLRLTPTPSDVVTRILPVVAPIGAVAVRCWSSVTLNVVATLLNETADTPATPPVNPLPVTATSVPGAPLDGLNPVITGVAASAGVTATVNASAIAANETTAPRTNARTRVFIFMPSRPHASSRSS